jgi:ubiquinone/menaquinone biosynthesis C-methylase UbiE
MDEYSYQTMTWLNRRYRKTNKNGIYIAHQPIYGFHDLNCEPNVLERYNRTFQIIKAISHLDVHSLVDIGAAEGFIASLARDKLGLEVECSDISEEACKRAHDIFGLKARQADARNLPFEDGQFDVALCSETLEHIVDYKLALSELLRVASKAVVITVPHETPELVNKNREQGELHAHINSFEISQFDYLKSQGFQVISRPFQSQYIYHPSKYIENFRTNRKNPLWTMSMKQFAGILLNFDTWISEIHGMSYALMFIILKNPYKYRSHPTRKVLIGEIINTQVSYLYLK